MFISKEQTLAITGYTVDSTLLLKAQSIIEAYVGKSEGEIEDASDLVLLGKAVAYQAAYMSTNTELIFEQMQVSQIGSFGQIMSFRQNDNYSPYVAPLAVISCRNLTWRRARSIKTGKVFGSVVGRDGWRTE